MFTRSRTAAVTLALLSVLTACCSQDSRPAAVDAPAGGLAAHGGARRLTEERSQTIRDAIDPAPARNVILLVGDGMGDAEITLARNYAHGAAGRFPGLDTLPLTGQVTTYALGKDGRPGYVTDSAAGASAWSTGTKTYPGALSIDIHGTPQPTLLELAKSAGLATGDVSTAAIQDATPAAQYAHLPSRRCYGPAETAQHCPAATREHGGPGSITEQLLTARPDVTLGGGAGTFGQVSGGQPLTVAAKQGGYQIVHTTSELAAVTASNQNSPVLGLFDDGDLPPRWTGPAAVRGGYLQPAVQCTDNPDRGAQVPTLAAMTSKAIALLNAGGRGFFLQVEGASIDKQAHAANPCGQIGETVDFDDAVGAALDFARTDGHTLVVVTADHGHATQIVAPVTEDDVLAIAAENRLPVERVRDVIYPGLTRVLLTADGAEMTVSYGLSADLRVDNQGHSGTQVRIGGYGPRAADVVGLTDQTDLFFTVAGALGLDRPAS